MFRHWHTGICADVHSEMFFAISKILRCITLAISNNYFRPKPSQRMFAAEQMIWARNETLIPLNTHSTKQHILKSLNNRRANVIVRENQDVGTRAEDSAECAAGNAARF